LRDKEIMKTTIIGDSYAYYYEDTFLEKICESAKLTIVDQIGFPGHSQFKIYKNFLKQLEKSPDIMICLHTECTRLFHEDLGINFASVSQKKFQQHKFDPDVCEAAEMYYAHLHNLEYAETVHKLMINDMQKLCRDRNIKMINIPCFHHKYVDKNYGLWLSVEPNGLYTFSKLDNPIPIPLALDTRGQKNHFTESGHETVANIFLSHIKKYINDNVDCRTVTFVAEDFK
jgi:hypothetical protein